MFSKRYKIPGLSALFFIMIILAVMIVTEDTVTAIQNTEIISENESYQFTEILFELEEKEILEEKYFSLVDTKGNLITVTGRRIRPGDRYLDQNNRLYEVSRVKDYEAIARYIRTEKLENPFRKNTRPAFFREIKSTAFNFIKRVISRDYAQEGDDSGEEFPRYLVALYHTHNAESYLPSDGSSSIYGRGGIHEVGAAFKDALEKKNIDVIHSENLHLPHDRGAYRRSRDTALSLLEKNPDVIFDLHRDAAPVEAYAEQIDDDEWVTRVQFVVGRQNSSYVITRRFAYDLKSLADDVYPGLVKGVFMGWGNYNQDLTPLNLLLEVGGHMNSKEAAEKGITYFADVVAFYFYGIPPGEENARGILPRAEAPGAAGGAVSGTIAVILLLVAGAAAGFYFLNNPSEWGRFREQLRLYMGRGGIVWREGYKNLVLLEKNIISGVRRLFVYLLIVRELISALLHSLRELIKKRLR